MANDRLYLVCKHCGAGGLLAKYYPGPYNPNASLQTYPGDVDEFIVEHIGCCPSAGGLSLEGDNCFNVLTEDQYDEARLARAAMT